MRNLTLVLLSCCCLLAACAGSGSSTIASSDDYVEIDNPAVTMSSGAPATIWVPRSYVETGVPRGGALIKSGVETVVDTMKPHPSKLVTVPDHTGGKTHTAVHAPLSLKSQIALLETGRNGLLQPFYESLNRAATVIVFDPLRTASLAQQSVAATESEKGAFAHKLQQKHNVNVTVYLSAPEGVTSGKAVLAEVFDSMGGGLLRRLEAVVQQPGIASKAGAKDPVHLAMLDLTKRLNDLMALIPWYASVITVEGSRAYISAGKDAGLRPGQELVVYRGGKFVEGLGFAPGKRIGTLNVSGFVGPNGAFCEMNDGLAASSADIVSVE